jgi:hypothetical protein
MVAVVTSHCTSQSAKRSRSSVKVANTCTGFLSRPALTPGGPLNTSPCFVSGGWDLSCSTADGLPVGMSVARFLSYKQRPSCAREDTLPNGISWASPTVNHCFAHRTWNHASDRRCKAHHCLHGLLPLRVARPKNARIAPSSQVPFRFAPATGRAPASEALPEATGRNG